MNARFESIAFEKSTGERTRTRCAATMSPIRPITTRGARNSGSRFDSGSRRNAIRILFWDRAFVALLIAHGGAKGTKADASWKGMAKRRPFSFTRSREDAVSFPRLGTGSFLVGFAHQTWKNHRAQASPFPRLRASA